PAASAASARPTSTLTTPTREPTMPCPDLGALRASIDDAAGTPAPLRDHVLACVACADTLAELQRNAELAAPAIALTRPADHPAAPARARRLRRHPGRAPAQRRAARPGDRPDRPRRRPVGGRGRGRPDPFRAAPGPDGRHPGPGPGLVRPGTAFTLALGWAGPRTRG